MNVISLAYKSLWPPTLELFSDYSVGDTLWVKLNATGLAEPQRIVNIIIGAEVAADLF